ncbi:MAG: hypothetical protein V1773_14175 [bacterium]
MKANIVFALLFSIIIGGCYTIYTHPNVVHRDENKRVDIIEVSYKNDCQSCHSEDELEKYNYYVKKDVFLDTDSSDNSTELKYNDIAYFYNMPWWFEVTLTNEYTPVDLEDDLPMIYTNDNIIYSPPGPEPGPGPRPYPPPYPGPFPLPEPTQPTGGDHPTKERPTTTTKEEPVTRPTNTNTTRESDGSKNTNSGRR